MPIKVRALLDGMDRMHSCEIGMRRPELGNCAGRVEWHHVWEYGQRGQINEPWAIVGACTRHHGEVKTNREVKEEFERASLEVASEVELAEYPRKPWAQIKRQLGTT